MILAFLRSFRLAIRAANQEPWATLGPLRRGLLSPEEYLGFPLPRPLEPIFPARRLQGRKRRERLQELAQVSKKVCLELPNWEARQHLELRRRGRRFRDSPDFPRPPANPSTASQTAGCIRRYRSQPLVRC